MATEYWAFMPVTTFINSSTLLHVPAIATCYMSMSGITLNKYSVYLCVKYEYVLSL
jgi:hypothetical protein